MADFLRSASVIFIPTRHSDSKRKTTTRLYLATVVQNIPAIHLPRLDILQALFLNTDIFLPPVLWSKVGFHSSTCRMQTGPLKSHGLEIHRLSPTRLTHL